MYVIYDWWVHDANFFTWVARGPITYPNRLLCNESVWIIPGTITD